MGFISMVFRCGGIRQLNLYKKKNNQTPQNKTYEKTININRYRQYRGSPGAIGSVSDHGHQPGRCLPERVLALAVGFQDRNGHNPQAATGSEWNCPGQMLGREVQREVILRVSHWHEGQDLRRETKAI